MIIGRQYLILLIKLKKAFSKSSKKDEDKLLCMSYWGLDKYLNLFHLIIKYIVYEIFNLPLMS